MYKDRIWILYLDDIFIYIEHLGLMVPYEFNFESLFCIPPRTEESVRIILKRFRYPGELTFQSNTYFIIFPYL